MSGVLSHTSDPPRLLRAASTVSDVLYIWTHHYDGPIIEADPSKKAPFRPSLNKTEEFAGRQLELHYRCLDPLGYRRIVIGHDEPGHIHGPSCSLVALR
jgi:hypothetical protein